MFQNPRGSGDMDVTSFNIPISRFYGDMDVMTRMSLHKILQEDITVSFTKRNKRAKLALSGSLLAGTLNKKRKTDPQGGEG